MYPKIFYYILIAFTFKFSNRANGHEDEYQRKFFPQSDLYFKNSTDRSSNSYADDAKTSWKLSDMNENESPRKRTGGRVSYNKNSDSVTARRHRFKPLTENYNKINPFVTQEYDKEGPIALKTEDYLNMKTDDASTTERLSRNEDVFTYQVDSRGPETDRTVQSWKPDDMPTRRFETKDNKRRFETEDNKRRFETEDNMPHSGGMKFIPVEKHKDTCRLFQQSRTVFHYEKMISVWQTMYYRLTEAIKCFQIIIKRVSQQQRSTYLRKYGNFSGAVDWTKVRLEISATSNIGRKHFLQNSNAEMGIMTNIIISRDVNTGDLVIHEEVPDQWLVVGHLLLMRDCESGGIVVFSKVPYVPRRREIEKALFNMNERYGDGQLACDDDEVINKSFEVEEDVQSFWSN